MNKGINKQGINKQKWSPKQNAQAEFELQN
jgi:hypothetical protein